MVKGEIYYAFVPFLPESPLDFFIEDRDTEGKKLGTGKIINADETFREKAGEKNSNYHVILPFKKRMVLIVSNDDLLKEQPSAIAMPIHTIHKEQEEKSFFKRLIESNLMVEAYYLGERFNGKSFVSIIDVKTISKTLIYEKVGEISEEEMAGIDLRFSDCLNNSIVLACQVCDRVCATCKLLLAANQLKGK